MRDHISFRTASRSFADCWRRCLQGCLVAQQKRARLPCTLQRFSHPRVSGAQDEHCIPATLGIDSRQHSVPNVRTFVKYGAVICLLLTFWSAVAVVAHHHTKGTESAKCSVCVAANTAAPKAAANAPKITYSSVAVFRPHAVSSKERFVAFALSVRPPPTMV